jgi:fibronectin-binding autotransporter adhesin
VERTDLHFLCRLFRYRDTEYRDGGQVATGPNIVFGGNTGASSTLNINSGGTLQTLSLRGGDGASQANFNDGILRATATNATFINSFTGTELTCSLAA